MNRLLLLASCLFSTSAFAQITSAAVSPTGTDAYWNISLTPSQKLTTVLVESQTQLQGPTSPANAIVLQQSGNSNQATLQTVSGNNNLLQARQQNDGNVLNAVLSGSGNGLIINQAGGNNQLNVDLTGSNNRFLLTQDGGDVANLQGLNQTGGRLELRQGAGNNTFNTDNSSLFTDPLSTGIPNLRIEQTGGANITVQQGRIIGQ
ncbi:MAG: hypothetical protein H7319_02895 [Spirosoma sp.]|nr:hypothetical protein [Spirosoma sp.]